MKTIYVDELETVWHRTRYEVPDEMTNKDIINFMEDHVSYELEELPGVKYIDSEYLYDAGELEGSYEIYDENWEEITHSYSYT